MDNYSFIADRPVESYRKSDTVFIITVILLWGLGIFTLYAVSGDYAVRVFGNSLYFVKRQLLSSAAGLAGLLLFAFMPIKSIRKLLFILTTGTVLLCLLTFVPGIGVERNGARRWIRIPFFSTFQPSEAVKVVTVLFLANLFDKQARIQNPEERSVLPSVLGLIFFVLIIFGQKDFSTGFFLLIVGILLFFIAGAKLSWLVPFTVLGVPAALLMVLLEPYRVNRFIAFLKPDEFLQGLNYQSFAAKRAISLGGFWGQGVGSGLTRVNSIPEVQADYIFAGWAESMGFIGVLVYMIILCVFAWRAYRIAVRCPDRFSAITVFGFTTLMFLQSLINCAVVCGVLPATGIPLVFFSSGGTSIMFALIMCGFIINASRSGSERETNFLDGELVYE
ncbi:MAG: FtsW/RodA/SpoVE family cell cycle protein [Treponema sp.]|jgi:cell division protein FtsW|nr:FtsW/RodA/SpoVE family cell cycle protein [Treponema sp.]